jgi:hypothetical protein
MRVRIPKIIKEKTKSVLVMSIAPFSSNDQRMMKLGRIWLSSNTKKRYLSLRQFIDMDQ